LTLAIASKTSKKSFLTSKNKIARQRPVSADPYVYD
jgi:hypothetical protein